MNYLQEESYKPFQSVPREACLYQNSKFCFILREEKKEGSGQIHVKKYR